VKNLTLTQKIIVVVGIAWLAGAGTSIVQVVRLKAAGDAYQHILSVDVAQQASARVMQVTFKKQVQEWKDTLLRGSDPDALQKYSAAFHARARDVQEQGSALRNSVTNAQARNMLEDFLQAHIKMSESYETALTVFVASKGTSPAVADAMVKGQDRAPTDLVDKIVDLLASQASASAAAEATSLSTERLIIWIVLAISFVGTGLQAFYSVNRIDKAFRTTVQELLLGTDQIASAAGQVASASQSLAQGSSEQAASIEQTSASSREIASVTRQNAENTKNSAQLMNLVEKKIVDANSDLGAMESSMRQIDTSSQKIKGILKAIEEIAFQTNILALNAAVEAARAGEAGMGFAVVADEVRNLAARSSNAARDTAGLIEESIARTGEGNLKLGQLAGTIRSITEDATKVRVLIQEISETSGRQSDGVRQVSAALAQMTQVTQQTAASSQESAAAAQQLNAQAESMRQCVSVLG
jgi:methyl-accepting chemotaxis protein